MKKVLFTMVLSMLAAAAYAGSVDLVPGAITVVPSTVFILEYIVTDVGPVESAGLRLTFDPALVHVLGVAEGEYIAQQYPPDSPAMLGGWNNMAGTLNVTVTRYGPNTSSGSGTAMIVTFHCEGLGVATLSFYAGVSDPDGTKLATKVGKVIVTQTPEPMTLALIGAALTALGLVARKRS